MDDKLASQPKLVRNGGLKREALAILIFVSGVAVRPLSEQLVDRPGISTARRNCAKNLALEHVL